MSNLSVYPLITAGQEDHQKGKKKKIKSAFFKNSISTLMSFVMQYKYPSRCSPPNLYKVLVLSDNYVKSPCPLPGKNLVCIKL
jgi:hypothetical protein